MRSLKVIQAVVFSALTSVVSAQSVSKCSSNITNQGYECCSAGCSTIYTDKDGDWGYENNKWCGCGSTADTKVDTNDKTSQTSKCSSKITDKGYSCCPSDCEVLYTDDDGSWGYVNNTWCGCSPVDDNNATNATNATDDNEKLFEEFDHRVEEVLSDDKEVERKWLIDKENIPYDLSGITVSAFDIKQTYICFDPEIRVREYTDASGEILAHEMTIKTNMSQDGLVRDEVNIDINQEQYQNMVVKQEGNTIYKTRYQFYDNGEIIAIDIFKGDLEGLAYMEIEFAKKEESDAFATPDWVIKDITDDIRYKNGHLARYGIPSPQ